MDLLGTHLHSSMVRLEILRIIADRDYFTTFTFQYGQIRNYKEPSLFFINCNIYIPVWLDQKLELDTFYVWSNIDLHSSMVRLEI